MCVCVGGRGRACVYVHLYNFIEELNVSDVVGLLDTTQHTAAISIVCWS